ncbi:hypothetical protein LguiB_030108 [Lonicera macranthoides]
MPSVTSHHFFLKTNASTLDRSDKTSAPCFFSTLHGQGSIDICAKYDLFIKLLHVQPYKKLS